MRWVVRNNPVLKLVTFLVLFCIVNSTVIETADARGRRAIKRDFTKSEKYAALVVDADSGEVVFSRSANKQRIPASLTKMMTLYLTFQALENGKLYYYQKIPVSQKAAMQPRTKLWLKKGQKITVRDAMLGLIIRSANDASVVLAEAIDGTEAKFAKRMTKTARELGMKNTTFHNASGLPNRYQRTTAYDMAKLAIALRRDFPKYYPLFSKTSFKFRGNIITSHNRVLTRYKWADGLKTGFTNASGYNLVTSTTHPNAKLIGVVMGGSSAALRDNHMIQILNYGTKRVINNKQIAAKKAEEKRVANTARKNNIFKFADFQTDIRPDIKVSAFKNPDIFSDNKGVFETVGINKIVSNPVFKTDNVFEYADKITADSEEQEFAEPKVQKKKPVIKKKVVRKKVVAKTQHKKKMARKQKTKKRNANNKNTKRT